MSNGHMRPVVELRGLTRSFEQGGVRIDDEQIKDIKAAITPVEGMILRVGKRKFAKLNV